MSAETKTPKELVLEKCPKARCATCFTGGTMWLLSEHDAKFQVQLDEPYPSVYTLCHPGKTATWAWVFAWYAISGEWVTTFWGKRTVS